MNLLYEGKSKRVYIKNGDTILIEFKDDVTAMDGAIKANVEGKGVMTAAVSAYLLKYLEAGGVKTHFIDYDGYRSITAKKLSIIPVEVIVRNYAYGSLLKRMPLYKPLQKLDPPLIEFHFKDDSLHDPLILPEDIVYTSLLKNEELNVIADVSLKANNLLKDLFASKNLALVDTKFEFGKDRSGCILLADEVSGDTFRVIDENGNHLDKEIFRKTKDITLLLKAYRELCKRLGIEVKNL